MEFFLFFHSLIGKICLGIAEGLIFAKEKNVARFGLPSSTTITARMGEARTFLEEQGARFWARTHENISYQTKE